MLIVGASRAVGSSCSIPQHSSSSAQRIFSTTSFSRSFTSRSANTGLASRTINKINPSFSVTNNHSLRSKIITSSSSSASSASCRFSSRVSPRFSHLNPSSRFSKRWFMSASNPKLFALSDESIEKLRGLDDDVIRDLYVKDKQSWDKIQLLLAKATIEVGETPEPTRKQLRLYFLGNFLPFLGFGFFDNSIMLLCGDFFDWYLGTTLGITTLTAAALGNIVGDVSGIWLGGTVEFFVGKHVQDHMLTTKQMKITRVQTIKTISMASGIMIGCILGMFPLFWPEEWRLWQSAEDVTSTTSEIMDQNSRSTTRNMELDLGQ